MPRPGIDQLLIASALDAGLRRRLQETPDEVFGEFDLTDEEKDILRRPDHRMLALLGATLARQAEAPPAAPPEVIETPPAAGQQGRALPDLRLLLTLVPCAQIENGAVRYQYAAWVSPLAEGADPATVPPPSGPPLPGQPLTPLRAVIHVSALELRDTAGNPFVGLWATLRQSTNLPMPPPQDAPKTAGAEVAAAVAAVRSASSAERYDRLLDLVHALRGGDGR